jgi:hypothetical protein
MELGGFEPPTSWVRSKEEEAQRRGRPDAVSAALAAVAS